MTDIELYTTPNGVASLFLKEIPYKQEARIVIRATQIPEALVEDCLRFCLDCGAKRIYATGHPYLQKHPVHSSVLRYQLQRTEPCAVDLQAVAVDSSTAQQWRSIYNDKMHAVDHAAYLTWGDAAKLPGGGAWFVYDGATLLGIGQVQGNEVLAVAAVVPGAGEQVLLALMALIGGDTVQLSVASTNHRAIRLYEKLGFSLAETEKNWYKII